MKRAGEAVAQLALALAPHAPLFLVCCGPGNNGGDGWAAATALHHAGRAVLVVDTATPCQLPHDAHQARLHALAAGVPQTPTMPTDWPAGSLLVDALLGLGTRNTFTTPTGALAQALAGLHRAALSGHTVLAVDLPSGLHPDTGQALAHTLTVHATHTLSLLSLKPGLFTGQGRDHAGQVWWHPVVDTAAPTPAATGTLNGRPAPIDRHHAQHKGSFGDVLVLGGAPGMAGALWLAARAALVGGAGRVLACALDPHGPDLDHGWPELMGRPAADWPRWQAGTVVAGCGGGNAIAAHMETLLTHPARLVLDADALNAMAAEPRWLDKLTQRQAPTVLTPHPLEAARLLGASTAQVQADRVAAAQALAARCQAVVVLKGSGSVLAHPGGAWALNPTGNALLASAGTGDVLAGLLGGRWSCQMATHRGPATADKADTTPAAADPPATEAALESAFEAACAATWWHGAAADLAWQQGQRQPLRASALVQALGDTLQAVNPG
jgi:hydroxyethylthiazole kinase-like uncharacterized protein yjeF